MLYIQNTRYKLKYYYKIYIFQGRKTIILYCYFLIIFKTKSQAKSTLRTKSTLYLIQIHISVYAKDFIQSNLYLELLYYDVLRDFTRKREQRAGACESIEYVRLEKQAKRDFHEDVKKKSAGTSRSEIATVNFAPATCYKRTSQRVRVCSSSVLLLALR